MLTFKSNLLAALLMLGAPAAFTPPALAQTVVETDEYMATDPDDDAVGIIDENDDDSVVASDDTDDDTVTTVTSVETGAADSGDMDRCAAQFRSFDPATGTYTTYAGETRTCPYLR